MNFIISSNILVLVDVFASFFKQIRDCLERFLLKYKQNKEKEKQLETKTWQISNDIKNLFQKLKCFYIYEEIRKSKSFIYYYVYKH